MHGPAIREVLIHNKDNAFVHNFNDQITAYVKSIAKPGVSFKVHHTRSDGCWGQYMTHCVPSAHFY